MRDHPVPEEKETSLIVIFTDLDGTLLDHDSYSWEEAVPALERCKGLRVPVILVGVELALQSATDRSYHFAPGLTNHARASSTREAAAQISSTRCGTFVPALGLPI